MPTREIARVLSVSPHTVTLWQQRYRAQGPDGLLGDAPGRGRKSKLIEPTVLQVKQLLATQRPDGRPWTIRRLAEVTGISRATVHRILRSRGIVTARPA